jgi:hypothetical protein
MLKTKSLVDRLIPLLAMAIGLLLAMRFSLGRPMQGLLITSAALLSMQVPAWLLRHRLRTAWLSAALGSAYLAVSAIREQADLLTGSWRMFTFFAFFSAAFAVLAIEEGARALRARPR